MAAVWRAFVKLFGIGKQEDKKEQPVRFHPYDEVSDDQLDEARRRPPRNHPYDEVSDEQLEHNRSASSASTPGGNSVARGHPRQHPYDEVQVADPPETTGDGQAPKMRIVSEETAANSAPGLNYVEVDVGPGGNSIRSSQQPTIYSEVRSSSKPS